MEESKSMTPEEAMTTADRDARAELARVAATEDRIVAYWIVGITDGGKRMSGGTCIGPARAALAGLLGAAQARLSAVMNADDDKYRMGL